MRKIIEFIRSEACLFIFFLAALAASTPHTAEVMANVSRYQEPQAWMQGLVYALIIEAAVLLFVVNGEDRAGRIYAIASLLCNIIFFHRWEELLSLDMNSSPQLIASVLTDLFSSLLISAMLSGSIWYFAKLFKKKLDKAELKLKEAEAELSLAKREQLLAASQLALSRQMQEYNKRELQFQDMIADFELRRGQVHECKECGEHFASEKALHGHKRKHSVGATLAVAH